MTLLDIYRDDFSKNINSDWLRNYTLAIQDVQAASEVEFRSKEFQTWLWELNCVGSIGFGNSVNISSAYDDPEVIDIIWMAKNFILSDDVNIRSREVSYIYQQILSVVTPRHNFRRPLARLARLFTVLFPKDVLCLFDSGRTNRLLDQLGLKWIPQIYFIGQHTLIRQYFREFLGVEKGWLDCAMHSQFSWFLLEQHNKKNVLSPTPPAFGPAAIFEPSETGFEIVPQRLPSTESNDLVQKTLFANLQRRIQVVGLFVDRIENGFPGLVTEYKFYKSVLGTELKDLDVASVWSAGAGLAEFVRAAEDTSRKNRIEDVLDRESLASFRALIGEHWNLMQGFSLAQQMLTNAQVMHNLNKPISETVNETSNVLTPMLAQKNLLSEQASALIQSLTRSLGALQGSSVAIVSISQETARNCFIAFGNSLQRLASSPLLNTITVSQIALQASGFEHLELVQTAFSFLTENEDAVMGLANANPQMSIWLRWVIEKLVLPQPRSGP